MLKKIMMLIYYNNMLFNSTCNILVALYFNYNIVTENLILLCAIKELQNLLLICFIRLICGFFSAGVSV